MPPKGFEEIVPSQNPLHDTSDEVFELVRSIGWVKEIFTLEIQPFASVTVTS